MSYFAKLRDAQARAYMRRLRDAQARLDLSDYENECRQKDDGLRGHEEATVDTVVAQQDTVLTSSADLADPKLFAFKDGYGSENGHEEPHRPASDACVLETFRAACVKEKIDPDLLSIDAEDGSVEYVGCTTYEPPRRDTLSNLAFDAMQYVGWWSRQMHQNRQGPTGLEFL